MADKVPITLKLAFEFGASSEEFKFLRTWTQPKNSENLTASSIGTMNIEYLVVDYELIVEDMNIRLPVPSHLNVDIKTLLEERRNSLTCGD